MSYWKSKVLPKFQKFFDKGKKKGASVVCKNFDKSKESLDKEFQEKESDLNPKVVEIYRCCTTFISKKMLKEPNEATVKENPEAVQGVLQELVKAGFPGAQVICDAGEKFGPALLPGPVVYLFSKASVYLVEEPLPEEHKAEAREVDLEEVKKDAPEEAAAAAPAEPPEAEPAVVVEEKEEEAKAAVEPHDVVPPPATPQVTDIATVVAAVAVATADAGPPPPAAP